MNIIITGSSGLIGNKLFNHYSQEIYDNRVDGIDIENGHDLTNEKIIDDCLGWGDCDVLINCFGLNNHITINQNEDNLYTLSKRSFSEFMQSNVTDLFNVCRRYAKYNSHGCVINFGSLYSHIMPDPKMSQKHPGYVASKHAVIGLTQYLAKYIPHIRFNCICPGGIENNQPKEFIDKYIDHTIIKRMCKIDDIIKACDYLIKSDYVTGQSIIVDGGYSL